MHIYLSCAAPPSAPRNLRIVEVSHNDVLIDWEPPSSDCKEHVLGYKIEKSLITDVCGSSGFVSVGYVDRNILSYRVTRLHEGCKYMFRVGAENRFGMGQEATTEQPVLIKMPFGK